MCKTTKQPPSPASKRLNGDELTMDALRQMSASQTQEMSKNLKEELAASVQEAIAHSERRMHGGIGDPREDVQKEMMSQKEFVAGIRKER